jgi:hypothetical protein
MKQLMLYNKGQVSCLGEEELVISKYLTRKENYFL